MFYKNNIVTLKNLILKYIGMENINIWKRMCQGAHAYNNNTLLLAAIKYQKIRNTALERSKEKG
jgi:hypothetical protein